MQGFRPLLSCGTMQIFVRNPFTTTLSLETSPSETSNSFKSRCQVLTIPEFPQLNPDDLRLTFAGRDLPDGVTLADMSITHGSMLSIDLRLRGGMLPQSCPLRAPEEGPVSHPKIRPESEVDFNMMHPGQIRLFIRTLEEQTLEVAISPDSNVSVLKEKIEAISRVRATYQRLLFSGQYLKDDKPLTEYRLRHENTIILSTLPKGNPRPITAVINSPAPVDVKEVQIFVKTLNGKTIALMVSPTDTVNKLMSMVEKRTQIPAAEQRLLYGGKQLEPGKFLTDYNITRESTLHLVLRLRGGF